MGTAQTRKQSNFYNVTAFVNVTRYSNLEIATQLNLGDVHSATDGLKIRAFRCFQRRENTERLCVKEVSGQVFQLVENLPGAL